MYFSRIFLSQKVGSDLKLTSHINWIALLSSLLLVSIAISAVFAPYIAPTNPYDLSTVSILDSRLSPGEKMFRGNVAFLGTDGAGRDVLSAIFFGLRTSLIVAIVSACVALTIGLFIGLISAYFGGIVDSFFMRIVDIQLSFPAILVALVLLALLGNCLLYTSPSPRD